MQVVPVVGVVGAFNNQVTLKGNTPSGTLVSDRSTNNSDYDQGGDVGAQRWGQ